MDTNNTKDIVPVKQEIIRDEKGRFPAGVSGNPNGRPLKGHSITDTIQAMMDEKPEIKKALGAKILQMAVEGDITAIRTIWSYLDGMPLIKQQIGGNDGNPIEVIVTEDKTAI